MIHHLATKSPSNPPPTSSTVAEAASEAGMVSSCDFASFGGPFGKGKRSEENWAQRGSEKRKPSTNVEHVVAKYHLCHLLIFGLPFFKLVDLMDASEQLGWCVRLAVSSNHKWCYKSQWVKLNARCSPRSKRMTAKFRTCNFPRFTHRIQRKKQLLCQTSVIDWFTA